MAVETKTIDEIADFLKESEARSAALFDNELSFVVDWKEAA